MRPIKFRAWNKPLKRMIYWGSLADVFKRDFADERNFVEDCNEFMQFTGLHDKNGKKIFEGDIVQNDNEYRFVIIWWPEQCGFVQLKLGTFFHEATTMPMAMNNKEILGNIYENPELLSERKEGRKV